MLANCCGFPLTSSQETSFGTRRSSERSGTRISGSTKALNCVGCCRFHPRCATSATNRNCVGLSVGRKPGTEWTNGNLCVECRSMRAAGTIESPCSWTHPPARLCAERRRSTVSLYPAPADVLWSSTRSWHGSTAAAARSEAPYGMATEPLAAGAACRCGFWNSSLGKRRWAAQWASHSEPGCCHRSGWSA